MWDFLYVKARSMEDLLPPYLFQHITEQQFQSKLIFMSIDGPKFIF